MMITWRKSIIAQPVDKVTVKTWRTNEEAHLRQLHGEMYADTYRSQPLVPGVYTETRHKQAKGRLVYPLRSTGCAGRQYFKDAGLALPYAYRPYAK